MSSQQDRSDVASEAASVTEHLEYLDQEKPPLGTRFIRWVTHPETTTAMLMASKAVVAATAAWALAVGVLDSEVAFMAPWTALLTVHVTVHRSLSRGGQTIAAVAIGMGLAFVVLEGLDVNVVTFALALLIGLLASRLKWIRDEGVAVATTAIFLFTADEPMYLERTAEMVLGVAIGVAVNFLIIPPLRDRQASRYVDSINRRMGAVLVDMADQFSASWDTDSAESWLKETDSMSIQLNSAWQVVRLAQESKYQNPRMIFQQGQVDQISYEHILNRVDEGISHLRNLTRTLREASYDVGEWDEQFREGWVDIAYNVGISIADPEGSVYKYFDQLLELSSTMSDSEELPNIEWPVYGALLSSLRHIVIVVDDVASARDAREPSEKTQA